jgi:HTH-type transcriptional regulator/antitoxin HigA
LVPTLPKEFADERTLEHLPEVLARHGVALVLLEPLPGTKIDGAAFWLGDLPVAALSLRFDRIDSFWFSLMHELAHLLLHGPSYADIDIDLIGPTKSEPKAKPRFEQEADSQASAWLVPPDELTRFIRETSPYYSHDKIARFAERLGVHTGVVVGQLQHRGEIGWGHSRKFLVKVRHYLPMES